MICIGKTKCTSEKGLFSKCNLPSSALPDLVLDTDLLKSHMEINVLPLYGLRCAMEENCLSKSAASQLR